MLLALRSLWERIIAPYVPPKNSRATISLVEPYRATTSVFEPYRATVSIKDRFRATVSIE